MKLKIQRLNPDVPMPTYAHGPQEDAGFDLPSDISVTLAPGQRLAIPTGLSIELPPGFEAQIRPRSGLALKHGITVLNAPGTIDPSYRGEIKVILLNTSNEQFDIVKGSTRIAQMVIARYEPVDEFE